MGRAAPSGTRRRGVRIPIVVAIAETEPSPERAEIVRHHLREARTKIDRSDYDGSFMESCKALELLRTLSPATTPIERKPQDRDAEQRIHAVTDAFFSPASAALHTGPPIKDFEPLRADAVALAAGMASVAQQVFARLD